MNEIVKEIIHRKWDNILSKSLVSAIIEDIEMLSLVEEINTIKGGKKT